MIRRDYIACLIEGFSQALAAIASLKKDHRWDQAQGLLQDQFNALTGLSADRLSGLSETELLAMVSQNEPTHLVPIKMLMLTTLLTEAAEVAAAHGGAQSPRQYYLKALEVLLATLARQEAFDLPQFVPPLERLLLNLQDAPLAPGTLSLLMHHYERTGQFGKAEDALFALLEAHPGNPALIALGIAFYQRLLAKNDEVLSAGNLPRSEAQEALSQLRRQSEH